MDIKEFRKQHSIPAFIALWVLIGLVVILAFGLDFLRFLSSHTDIPYSKLKEAYPEALIIIGIATFTTWVAIWRGRQAQEQIKKTEEQIRQTKRQVSIQKVNNAVDMATDINNPPRVRVGLARLRDLHGEAESEEERDSLRFAQSLATSILGRGSDRGQEIEVRARRVALRFLMTHPPEEWIKLVDKKSQKEERWDWQWSEYDMSGLNLTELLKEGIEQDKAREKWRVIARDSVCKYMRAQKANLVCADFSGATLTDADLRGADLTSADLTGADLTKANLTGADLTGVILTSANLTITNLTDANLWDVKFDRTRIDQVDFQQAKIINPETGEEIAVSLQDLKGCCWNKRHSINAPILPGIDPNDLDDWLPT